MSTPSSIDTPSSTDRLERMQKPTKIIILKITPARLMPYSDKITEPVSSVSRKASKSKFGASSASTPAPLPPTAPSSGDNISESNSTPAPAPTTIPPPPPVETTRRKGIPGPKPGTKRGIAKVDDGPPKPRGKPGPKKKPRLEDGTIDHSAVAAKPTSYAAHKLGPKANQGAINAGLRALDRSGKPCRKWERKAFQLKSFTGVVWELPSWRAPKRDADPTAEKKDGTTGDSDSKANNSSSAVESEKSNSGDGENAVAGNGINSPAPQIPELKVEG